MKSMVGQASAHVGGAQCAPYTSTGGTPVPPGCCTINALQGGNFRIMPDGLQVIKGGEEGLARVGQLAENSGNIFLYFLIF
jgi:hypothetical protein